MREGDEEEGSVAEEWPGKSGSPRLGSAVLGQARSDSSASACSARVQTSLGQSVTSVVVGTFKATPIIHLPGGGAGRVVAQRGAMHDDPDSYLTYTRPPGPC